MDEVAHRSARTGQEEVGAELMQSFLCPKPCELSRIVGTALEAGGA
jgi:hypothetical protein